jgi:LuxR family maltose regulon positive regulatory protein
VWYRSHPLFRAALLDDLALHDSLLIPVLHARASHWWEANGSIDEAIEHALAAGQRQRAAALAARGIIAAYYTGRVHAAETWLQRIGEEAIAADPMLAVLAGWIAALTGHATEALHWLDRADRCPAPESSPEGQPAFESVRSALRGYVCAHGVDEMAVDASRVVEHEPPWSSWATIGLGLLASARWLQGDLDEARAYYAESVDAAAQSQAWVPLTRWLAYRALLSMDRDDWDGAAEDVEQALAMIDAKKLSEYATSANSYAAASRLALHRGDVEAARAALMKAMSQRESVTWASPWASLLLRVQLVEAHLTLGDPRGARIILREIDDVLHHRPKLGLLNARVERIRDTLSTIGAGAPTSTLSTAELRLLPYLQTHITMGAIAERLFVSRNTVATQAKSIYRKLGASSRDEAVQRAREVGLLPGSSTV